MGRHDALPGESESVEAVLASDHFIEQLRVNGTYEPASRTDAALASALLTWRDDSREAPLSAPPRIEPGARSATQPRRVARRSVAVAGALLAMSSAMATALDADPLEPVRFLVDLGVSVGERIGNPNSESSTEVPSEPIVSPLGSASSTAPIVESPAGLPMVGPSLPHALRGSDAGPLALEPSLDGQPADPTDTTTPSDAQPTEDTANQPTDSASDTTTPDSSGDSTSGDSTSGDSTNTDSTPGDPTSSGPTSPPSSGSSGGGDGPSGESDHGASEDHGASGDHGAGGGGSGEPSEDPSQGGGPSSASPAPQASDHSGQSSHPGPAAQPPAAALARELGGHWPHATSRAGGRIWLQDALALHRKVAWTNSPRLLYLASSHRWDSPSMMFYFSLERLISSRVK